MPDDEPLAGTPPNPSPALTFPVVGIGASAGGLEALSKLLSALPTDTGMGFVVVQHLSPDLPSSLADILSRTTRMPVREVADEPAVEPDHVYVIPPGRDMIVAGGKLVLLPQPRHVAHRGIDLFFRTLADDAGHLAIGVVLSGGLNDGTVGLEEIKAAGGVTFAQDGSAEHESMPRSAVASGCVDFVLPPGRIAEELARISRHSYVGKPMAAEAEDAPAGHGPIADIVRGATGVDFTHYKASTLRRRITRRMMLHRIETQAEYAAHLRAAPEEVEELYQDILISVTSFFRDPDAFDALQRDVFPKLIAAAAPGEAVRLWIVGCASGEEAYSLAMAFTECAEEANPPARLQIFATDVNPRCVEKARAGWYPRSIAQNVSAERLKRFFHEEGNGYRVRRAVRERCVFSRHNLLVDPPFSRVDFISCRNLLIYLEPVLQQKVIPLFHYALKPDGWLWLGSSESVGTSRTYFEAADLRHKIFSRRAGDRPSSPRIRNPAGGAFATEASGPRPPIHGALHREAERRLLAKYAPPGVVVSAGLEIVLFQGDTSPFLASPSGTASHHLLKMLREGLAGGVREAVRRAEKENNPVRVEGLRVRDNGGFRTLAVEVIPIRHGPTGRDGGFMVLFDAAEKPAAPEPPRVPRFARWRQRLFGGAATAATEGLNEEILHLRQELAATRESLLAISEQHEAVTEELRSANEEAQSANEELQSVNEELETSKEEMEASNDELVTLNSDLARGNAELSQANETVRAARDYAERILENVPRPLLVLDADLRVRRANHAFCEIFSVTPAETIGRFVYELGNRQWDIPRLRKLLEEVLPQNGEVRDFEVRQTFPALGPCIMLLNARRLPQISGGEPLMILSVENITERKEASEAVARLAAIVRSSDDAIVSKDLDGIITTWNAGAERLFGYRAEEIVGKPVTVFIPPERLAEETLILSHIRRGEPVDHMETVRRRKDGTLIHVSLTVSPLVDHEGRIIGASKIARDITARKQLDEQLRRALEFDDAVMNNMAEGLYTLDDRGEVTYMNPAAETLFGWTFGELRGRRMHDVTHHHHRDGRPFPAEEWAGFQVLRQGHVLGGQEDCFIRKDGTFFDVIYSASPLRDGDRFTGLVVVFRDVTETRTANRALRSSEARMEAILRSALDAIMIMDHRGRLVEFNPTAERIFGFTRADVIGRRLPELIIPEPHRAEFEHLLAPQEASPPSRLMELPALRADGAEFPAEFALIVIPDTEPPMFTAFLRDITARKQTEQVLIARAEELARADRSKDEFLAMLAHELRNPLAPLRNAVELLRTANPSAEEREQAQGIINRQIENMSRMIDDLLDVSRINEGKVELRRQPVVLQSVLNATADSARFICLAHRQQLTLRLPDEPILLDADATRLEQIFSNLLGNASKYSGEGTRIWLSAEPVAGAEPPEVAVSVRDDGAGIAPDLLPRIFDLFVQATRSLDRAQGGLGIGLTLVQRLVTLHGGRVEARSDGLGHGAEFIVHLPILRETAAAATPASPPATPPETPRRILIVDDHADSARSMAVLQRRRGHEVRTAFTGPEALAVAAEFLPQVVLLDIGLPDLDGFEVARRLRAMPALAGAFLVALSGYASEADRVAAKAAGFDEYMVKPPDFARLREWLRNRA